MTLAYNKNDRGNNMNNNQQVVNFSVEIELVDNKANFTYYIGDDQVSGGGEVRTKTAAIYTLKQDTFNKGFLFSSATITGNCADDFLYVVNNNGKSITITDTDETSGTASIIFNVECNGTSYSSSDPQVINKEEI
ncbi:MAG: hypothetical protein ACJAVX_002043 [Pseudoalteromonas rhizosphaerae]|jgi:hypothetical protein|tara:strand:+ start:37 stop:441 length:405 start_codon:yes stop_codon:yes gene_type:complete